MALDGKNIILGVCASIAAYKACDIIRRLIKYGANVECILTQNGAKFITPLALQTLSRNKVYTGMFEKTEKWEIEHISLAQKADIILIAPATADIIARLAAGRADDLLCSTVLASKAKIVICPAMNANMFNHKATQKNIETLKSYGYYFVMPQKGELACAITGDGRLADIETIISELTQYLA
ncbi:MAG: bifunctional phosphopantothenoylcysteine decarboxylase/phosphopantothenate--cysteine ligase CoaBC [Endomicrobium sp.]|jgi:phosphopantothenoylcysteine decarboxylase/phosphopantothenate--cysteine ligase|nr:bifunctional phosphopantothenoylcysteine decarboxylase/phosphopantothenate--cysteine ligase CoaBC [Endomicrobium sp.]